MARFPPQNNLLAGSRSSYPVRTRYQITISTQRVVHIAREQAKQRRQIEIQATQVRLNVAKLQLGVWYYRRSESDAPQNRAFSIEYERDFLPNAGAYIHLVYEHGLICIDISQKEEKSYFMSAKFSNIRNLGTGYDTSGQPFILFDLHMPPTFEVQTTDNRAPDGTKHKWASKARDRLSALDDAHARIAPYAHQLRVLLANRDDLRKFEELCHTTQGNCRPLRTPRVDASPQGFFSDRYIHDVYRWTKTMDWKNAFQVEAYLRCGLVNTHDLLFSLQKPIESFIRDYGDNASEVLRLFSVALRKRSMDEIPSACLASVRDEYPFPAIKSFRAPQGHFLCRHVVITPTRILPEGPYITLSNRVIRHYQSHDPTFVERFVRVEFRDEDNLAYRWDGDVDGSWFLRHRVGSILRDGFELGGREFEFLAYSMESLHEHAVWFVAPFRDPVEGYVNAEIIRASLGDFSGLVRMPSKYAARIAQAFTATEPSVKIRRGQWKEQDDLGPHTDGVGTISPELAEMIWDENRRVTDNPREHSVKPSAYQFRFLGYRGVVVVDHRLHGIKMRLRPSQRKFSVHDVKVAEFEIVRSFNRPDPAHLNRPLITTLEDLGVKTSAFTDLQDAVKRRVYTTRDSLEGLPGLLKSYGIGEPFHLAFILNHLTKLGLGPKDTFDTRAFRNGFLGRLLRDSTHHVLRELKYHARIPVPGSYQLVGVADEGQGYIREGADPKKVFTLKKGHIYVCVQEAVDKEPIYLEGPCLISRDPVIHPGDVQCVYAVGMPPTDKICFFRDLKNVVVLPAIGDCSLASSLNAGDLDGNTYNIYFGNSALLPTVQAAPAYYSPDQVWTLDEGHSDATVGDICDFFVEFMMSDSTGLLADRHTIIADQSKDGVFDDRCMKLARLGRAASNYATNGSTVRMDNKLPKPSLNSKPDWHRPEVPKPHQVDYYESKRVLGHLFRDIDLHSSNEISDWIPITSPGEVAPLEDGISRTLAPLVQNALKAIPGGPQIGSLQTESIFTQYASEMRFICTTHGAAVSPDGCLTEEEVVLGTILAKCTQPGWRAERAGRMRTQAETLVRNIRAQVVPVNPPLADEELRRGLRDAWVMWGWAQHHREEPFIQSFSLIALGLVLELLGWLRVLPVF
ncbi:RNA dependent RNA polymerase-domain-containing protein [Russula brevipes]|nr:RNA dependent RNA polymerase-domain-containing protein [Russula brevipes]